MLKRVQSILAGHVQAASHSLNLLSRNPLATLMTTLAIAITLALPTLFWTCTSNLSQMSTGWQQRGQISLYLKPGLTEVEQKVFLQKVRDMNGVGQVSLKSAAEGLAELTQQEGMQDIMRHLPENPLPDMIELVPAVTIDSPAKLELLTKQLGILPQVDQAKLDMEWITKLEHILGFASQLTKALMLLLALAVVLIIANTLRLAIHNRQEEIQILKLIGATDSYILRPFLYTGMWYGIASALLAVLVVNIFILSLYGALKQLAQAYQMNFSLPLLSLSQILLLLLFAIILGWLGARLSVKRQIALIDYFRNC